MANRLFLQVPRIGSLRALCRGLLFLSHFGLCPAIKLSDLKGRRQRAAAPRVVPGGRRRWRNAHRSCSSPLGARRRRRARDVVLPFGRRGRPQNRRRRLPRRQGPRHRRARRARGGLGRDSGRLERPSRRQQGRVLERRARRGGAGRDKVCPDVPQGRELRVREL